MKIICSKTNLLNAIQTVMRAVSSKSTMSIIEYILIDASEDDIRLTGNNMELAIETVLEGEIMEHGIIALEAKILHNIVRLLPDNDVRITVDENYYAIIRCEKSEYKIVGRSGDDFPRLPEVEKNNPLTISHLTLKDIVRQTIFSTSENESNKVMGGELIEIKNNELKIVALDGHRISIRKLELRNEHSDIKVIVPAKTLNEVSKILSNDSEKILDIFFTDKHVLFEFENTVVVSRMIEGEYYDVDQMLSNDYETKFEVRKRELQDCIERATILIDENNKKPIIMNVTDDDMELKLNSVVGSLNDNIEISKEGQDIMIGFTPKFFIDALKVIDDEIITVYMVNPKAPCIIKNDEESYIYLILPVNFNTVQ